MFSEQKDLFKNSGVERKERPFKKALLQKLEEGKDEEMKDEKGEGEDLFFSEFSQSELDRKEPYEKQ